MTTKSEEMDKFGKLMCEIQKVRNEIDTNALNERDKIILAAYDEFSVVYG